MRSFPLPVQFRQKVPSGEKFFNLISALNTLKLHTVCEEAKCPNRSHCYERGTLTFQILGDICTRRCGFCAETTGVPSGVDFSEPQRIVEAVKTLHLSHVVITAPARDDLPDGGASAFSATIRTLKSCFPDLTVEVLISDLKGEEDSLSTVLCAQPDILNHNLETVRRLTPRVRAKATYDRSLKILKLASDFVKTKSGLMVGLGEDFKEILEALGDLAEARVSYLTMGQYLQPSSGHLSIEKYYSPQDFEELKNAAEDMGFEKVFCGPLVRSSFHAGEMLNHV